MPTATPATPDTILDRLNELLGLATEAVVNMTNMFVDKDTVMVLVNDANTCYEMANSVERLRTLDQALAHRLMELREVSATLDNITDPARIVEVR